MNFFLSSRWSVRLALIIIALLALIALTSQWWLPYDPQAIDLPSRLLSPDAQHWLGTDHLGRDIFSRLMAATRVSLGSRRLCASLIRPCWSPISTGDSASAVAESNVSRQVMGKWEVIICGLMAQSSVDTGAVRLSTESRRPGGAARGPGCRIGRARRPVGDGCPSRDVRSRC